MARLRCAPWRSGSKKTRGSGGWPPSVDCFVAIMKPSEPSGSSASNSRGPITGSSVSTKTKNRKAANRPLKASGLPGEGLEGRAAPRWPRWRR